MIALAEQGELRSSFRGTVEGELLSEPRGDLGFGYDPLFYYPPFGATFGEASREKKTEVSARGKALSSLAHMLI